MKELLHDRELNMAIEKQKELVRDHECELSMLKSQLEDLEEQLKKPEERAKKWLALQEMIWTNNFVVNYVRGLEKQIEELKTAKENDQPEHKPLWVVVPKEGPDDAWREARRGIFGQIPYHVYMSKAEAEENILESGKVVPVWGE
jgi:hypothetical protein